jgi:hypothetical protein
MDTPPLTEILGFSQTYQWYAGQPFPFPIADPTFEPQRQFLAAYPAFANCQARFAFGGDLSRWRAADYMGYEGHVTHALTRERREITRLVFNISGETRPVDEWTADIEAVLKTLRQKYPNLEELYLQPVIGGVDDRSGVRAVKNHPAITEAVSAVVGRSAPGLLKVGAVVKLEAEAFTDLIGHITVPGAMKAREMILRFYHLTP